MSHDHDTPAGPHLGPIAPSGEPLGDEQVLAPEQPPMDDAAGGPQAESDEDFAAAARTEPAGRGGA